MTFQPFEATQKYLHLEIMSSWNNNLFGSLASTDIQKGHDVVGCNTKWNPLFCNQKRHTNKQKWWRMQRNVIPSFVVRKDIPEGNNSARCNESHSLFCSQKRHAKLENAVNGSHSLKPHRLFSSQKKVPGATKCHPLLWSQLVRCLNS